MEAEAASWGRLRWAWVGAEETENGRAYRYDARGRVVADTLWVAGVGYTTTYAYDSGDRVTALTYPDGEVVSHEYDDEGAGCFVSG